MAVMESFILNVILPLMINAVLFINVTTSCGPRVVVVNANGDGIQAAAIYATVRGSVTFHCARDCGSDPVWRLKFPTHDYSWMYKEQFHGLPGLAPLIQQWHHPTDMDASVCDQHNLRVFNLTLKNISVELDGTAIQCGQKNSTSFDDLGIVYTPDVFILHVNSSHDTPTRTVNTAPIIQNPCEKEPLTGINIVEWFTMVFSAIIVLVAVVVLLALSVWWCIRKRKLKKIGATTQQEHGTVEQSIA